MVLDFNHRPSLSERIAALVDAGMVRAHSEQPPRDYLGASRLGASCERRLQFEYADAPVDPGCETSAQMLRIFERGHVMEACMAGWLRAAGFVLETEDDNGQQFGFSALAGRLQGHIDGVIVAGPDLGDGTGYPALWENKCLNAKAFRDLQKSGLAVAKPIYAAQVALYQAYLGLHEHPALFTAINANTMELYAELVPFDALLAQKMSDRAVRVIEATKAGDLLPRGFAEASHFECKFCPYSQRCWRTWL